MRTFLINLEKDKERLAAADRQLKALGLSYERFPAVYGKNLSKEEIKLNVSRIRTLSTHGKMWSPGQIGCTLSHLFLYKRMSDEHIPCALVLEDDVKFSCDFHKALSAVENCLDITKRQVILFSDHTDNVHQRLAEYADVVNVLPIVGDICAEAYVITLPAAREIYRVNYPMAVMVDAWARFRKRGHIELYKTEPPLAKQNRDDFGTNIEMSAISSNVIIKVGWKLWRLLGVVLDSLYFHLRGR